MAAKVGVFVDENYDFIKYSCHMAAKVDVFFMRIMTLNCTIDIWLLRPVCVLILFKN